MLKQLHADGLDLSAFWTPAEFAALLAPIGGRSLRSRRKAANWRGPKRRSPKVEAGNVYLPNPHPHGRSMPERAWVEDFLHQLTVFPRGEHDDDVDAFTQLLVRWQKPRVSCVW